MTTHFSETETEIRLRRANESLAALREEENELRRKLGAASEAAKRAKERMEEAFHANQQAVVKKLKGDYGHYTK